MSDEKEIDRGNAKKVIIRKTPKQDSPASVDGVGADRLLN